MPVLFERDAPALDRRNQSADVPAVIGVTVDGRISRWDERAAEIYGKDARQMIGMPIVQLAPGHDPKAREWLRAVVDLAGEPRDKLIEPILRTRAMRPDLTSAPVSFDAGPPRPRRSSTAALVVVRQLGEHQPDPDAELHMLRRRVRALQTAITASKAVAIVIDEDGFIRHVANTETLTSGWSPLQLVGRSPLDFVHPDDRSRASRILAEVEREPGQHPPVTIRGLDHHGQPHWVEGVLVNALDDPEVRGIVATFTDLPGPLPRQTVGAEDTPAANNPDDEEQRATHRIRRDVQRAFDEMNLERDLHLSYHPVVELRTGQRVAAHAQLRWQHPALDSMDPETFTAAAEANGTIVSIGRWVLANACRDAMRAGYGAVLISVSGRQLGLVSLVDDVADALEESGLPAQRLVLEASEAAVLGEWPAAAETLRQLKKRGVRIVLNGFATSHLAVKQLRHVPIDAVKVDPAIVARVFAVDSDDSDREILASTVRVAQTLSEDVVVGEVETIEQRDLLASLGCTHALGKLFESSKPMSVDDSMRAKDSMCADVVTFADADDRAVSGRSRETE